MIRRIWPLLCLLLLLCGCGWGTEDQDVPLLIQIGRAHV